MFSRYVRVIPKRKHMCKLLGAFFKPNGILKNSYSQKKIFFLQKMLFFLRNFLTLESGASPSLGQCLKIILLSSN